jgi:cytochrome c peroxidase
MAEIAETRRDDGLDKTAPIFYDYSVHSLEYNGSKTVDTHSGPNPRQLCRTVRVRYFLATVLTTTLAAAMPCVGAAADTHAQEPDGLRLSAAYPEENLGDRLFFDTRFAQYFFAHSPGDVNAPLEKGDPLVDKVPAVDRPALAGPFRGKSISCRQCHLGDDFITSKLLAGRTYVDFSRRSPIPERGDGLVSTPRNSPSMVDLGLPREAPVLLHFDGEFATPEDLTIASFTGRNFGWLPEEERIAVAHIARVIREDNGTQPRYVLGPDKKGIPYRVVMLSTDPDLPPYFKLPEQYRIDVLKASDDQVLEAIAKFMHAYMDSIRFGTHNTFRETGSPYDLFLKKNGLPAAPESGESNLNYSQRLLTILEQNGSFKWVTTPRDGAFKLHDQPYRFGKNELQGLKIFLTRAQESGRARMGNCVACHTPPQFTDQRLHNNGVSQAEYDRIFGVGAFAALKIPGLAERNTHFDDYLPPSTKHVRANGRFRTAPAAGKPGYTDLGAWNVFANPDLPKPQQALTQILCGDRPCEPEAVLPLTVAVFKTASVRDLGQSNPYFHSGALDTIEDTLHFYVRVSELARAGKLRNGSPEIAGIHLAATDIMPLAAFLRSLNEDYH